MDLVNLEGAVDEQGKVRDADPDDLNRILRDEGVPDENDLVYESQDKQTKEGRDRL